MAPKEHVETGVNGPIQSRSPARGPGVESEHREPLINGADKVLGVEERRTRGHNKERGGTHRQVPRHIDGDPACAGARFKGVFTVCKGTSLFSYQEICQPFAVFCATTLSSIGLVMPGNVGNFERSTYDGRSSHCHV